MEGYDMPTDIQFKDELRKEEIKLEEYPGCHFER